MRNMASFVLGGGRGTRLYPLTQHRSKPAVPLAGKYRLIDIPLSNCINSGLNRLYVLTQFMSASLHRHIRQTYWFDPFSGGFVEILAAQQTMDAGTDWYEGTADAVRKNLRYIDQRGIEYVLVLSGDQLYRMDFREMLRTHIESGADASIAGIPVTREATRSLGVMRLDESGRVVGFLEKPQTDPEIDSVAMSSEWMRRQGVESHGRECLASMGIYLFNKQTLLDVLNKTTYQDFGREIFPASIRTRHVQLHLFDGYWEDIGTIRAFYDANLAIAQPESPFELMVPEAPIYSRARFLPPSRVGECAIRNSLIADGCSIGHGTTIENSVVGLRCIIGSNATVRDSIIMGSDEYETDEDLAQNRRNGVSRIGIGESSLVVGCIVDKNCRIGSNVRIYNEGRTLADVDVSDACMIRDGIPVITKGAVIPDGWQLPT